MIVDDCAGEEVKDTGSAAPASGVTAVERSCRSSSSLGTIAGRPDDDDDDDDGVVDVIV